MRNECEPFLLPPFFCAAVVFTKITLALYLNSMNSKQAALEDIQAPDDNDSFDNHIYRPNGGNRNNSGDDYEKLQLTNLFPLILELYVNEFLNKL